MKRWEFNAMAFDYDDDRTWPLVDEMGAEGWELVTVVHGERERSFYFKREIPENRKVGCKNYP